MPRSSRLAQRIPYSELSRQLPPEWPGNVRDEIRCALQGFDQKVVVFDDDPKGTQTVHGIPVLTDCSEDRLQAEFQNDLPAFYILTNSRSLAGPQARELNLQIVSRVSAAASLVGRKFVVVSRSDSTLRGHFPDEVEALMEGLEHKPEIVLLVPFFLEGGRFTWGDIHYVLEGDQLVPAGQTEFARDPVFGYQASNLRQWVEEKTRGAVLATSVESISLEDIRVGGPARIQSLLQTMKPGSFCVVNCVSPRDLEVFTLGLLQAEGTGKRFLYRTAASFVPVRCGIDPRPLLSCDEVSLGESGGLIVVGSYVPRTTAQLQVLLNDHQVVGLELDVRMVLDSDTREEVIHRLAFQASRLIAGGSDVAIFTSRELVAAEAAEKSLAAGARVSAALVELVQRMDVRPRYLLAKGGITSNDLATHTLCVERAMVLGQALPGVPVWELGPESRYPGMPYVVFPGNVGDADSLARIVSQWRKKQ